MFHSLHPSGPSHRLRAIPKTLSKRPSGIISTTSQQVKVHTNRLLKPLYLSGKVRFCQAERLTNRSYKSVAKAGAVTLQFTASNGAKLVNSRRL